MLSDDQLDSFRRAIADRSTFVQLVLADVAPDAPRPAYRKIAVRRCDGDAADNFQVSYFTAKQHITRNQSAAEVAALLSLPFTHAHLQSTAGDLHVRITRKGKVLFSRGRPSQPQPAEPSTHDRAKQHLLPADRPHALLQALGIQTTTGQIRSSHRDKFHQINQFLDIVASLDTVRGAKGPFRAIDCGCGAAHLTFAAHHYLKSTLGLDAQIIGVDTNADLIGKCATLRDTLHCEGLTFECRKIGEHAPASRPHLVLSLHACDTATDEAIALGVRSRAQAILAAPCCQHELREQIAHEAMHALLRHGVLRSRLADLVTDAARAALLRVAGYTCDVIEFISPEHTGKNVMLRAERRSSKPLPGAEEDYAQLKAAWHIAPTLERLLFQQP